MKEKVVTILNIEDNIVQISCFIIDKKPFLIFNENYKLNRENRSGRISNSLEKIFANIYKNTKIKISDYHIIISEKHTQMIGTTRENEFHSPITLTKKWYQTLLSDLMNKNSNNNYSVINIVPVKININNEIFRKIPYDISIKKYKIEFKLFTISRKERSLLISEYKCKNAQLKSLIVSSVSLQMYVQELNLKRIFPKTFDKDIMLINFLDKKTIIYKYNNKHIQIYNVAKNFGIEWIFSQNKEIYNNDYNQYTLMFFSPSIASDVFRDYDLGYYKYDTAASPITYDKALNVIDKSIEEYINRYVDKTQVNYIILGRMCEYINLPKILKQYRSINWYIEKNKTLRMPFSIFAKIYGAILYILL